MYPATYLTLLNQLLSQIQYQQCLLQNDDGQPILTYKSHLHNELKTLETLASDIGELPEMQGFLAAIEYQMHLTQYDDGNVLEIPKMLMAYNLQTLEKLLQPVFKELYDSAAYDTPHSVEVCHA